MGLTCPDGMTRYQARNHIHVEGETMDVWTVRCLPPTTEVGQLLALEFLVAEVDGAFPDPVVLPTRCCGH